jgi:UDP-galactopyranose mutase
MYDYLIVGSGLFGSICAYELTNKEKNIIFGGRLAEYKYYDMHQVITSALNTIKNLPA